MSKLVVQLQRLFGLSDFAVTEADVAGACAGSAVPGFDLADQAGGVRVMLIGVERPGDWAAVAALYQGLQADLDLPAPAISISARAGFQVWLVLAGPVPVEQAESFLHALRRKYLGEIPVDRIRLLPTVGEGASRVTLVPSFDAASGKWSAFIDPSMGSMFIDEPGLEMAPNPDRQADMLAGIERIELSDFQRALARLAADAEAGNPVQDGPGMSGSEGTSASDTGKPRAILQAGSSFTDPKSFLLAVMNDPSASAKQRIRAAKALLPYF